MKIITPDELAEIDLFLQAWPHVTLATSDAHGKVQAAVIGVAVSERRELVFDTLESTRKYPNLIANPQVAVTIGWDDHRTIQLEGTAELLVPGTATYASLQALYLARFPSGSERVGWPGIAYFRVRPSWLRYSDYRSGEPRIFELAAATLAH